MARPLLVKFKDAKMKDHVMMNLKNLQGIADPFAGIGISHDLTPRQREETKQLLTSAKEEHVKGSSEPLENFRFLVVGQGARRKVIKIRK